MIIEAIMNLLKVLILAVIALFPKLPDTSGLITYVAPFFDVMQSINQFVSVPLLATCISVLLLFSNIELVWGVIMWVVRKIPGVS